MPYCEDNCRIMTINYIKIMRSYKEGQLKIIIKEK